MSEKQAASNTIPLVFYNFDYKYGFFGALFQNKITKIDPL